MIRALDPDASQQIRVNPMLQVALAQVRTGTDPLNTDLPHMASRRSVINRSSCLMKDGGNATRSVKRAFGVDLVDSMLDATSSGDGGTA